MTTVLLDTHVVQWWSAEPERVSKRATAAITEASTLAVAAVTWYELAWLARNGRITIGMPVRSWLDGLADSLHTFPMTPAIADEATSLPTSFPGDPADRMIYATALQSGLKLITKDARLRRHRHSRAVTIW